MTYEPTPEDWDSYAEWENQIVQQEIDEWENREQYGIMW